MLPNFNHPTPRCWEHSAKRTSTAISPYCCVVFQMRSATLDLGTMCCKNPRCSQSNLDLFSHLREHLDKIEGPGFNHWVPNQKNDSSKWPLQSMGPWNVLQIACRVAENCDPNGHAASLLDMWVEGSRLLNSERLGLAPYAPEHWSWMIMNHDLWMLYTRPNNLVRVGIGM